MMADNPQMWSKSQIESAEDELTRALDPCRDGAGNWPTFMRWQIRKELEAATKEQCNLDISTVKGQARFHELRGIRATLERLLTKDFGLSESFRKVMANGR